jgi:acyl-coenzyme A thioesterase PaaI-like protein
MTAADPAPPSGEDDRPAWDPTKAFFEQEDPARLSPRRALSWRIGDSVREIVERLVATQAPDADLAGVAVELEAVAAHLRGFRHGRRYEGYAEAANAGGGPPTGHVDYSPVLGRANPLAPPIRLRLEEHMLIGEVRFGSAYEGPPGSVHGGIVAAAFDEVLGATQALSGRPGMTGTLTVRYRAPTPLHTDLRFEAVLDRLEGRKLFCSARLLAGEVLCAEADGIFITVDFSALAQLKAERDAAADERSA